MKPLARCSLIHAWYGATNKLDTWTPTLLSMQAVPGQPHKAKVAVWLSSPVPHLSGLLLAGLHAVHLRHW